MKIKKTFLFVLASLLLVGCNGTSYEEVKDTTEANSQLQEAVRKNQEATANLTKMNVKTKIVAKGENEGKKIDTAIEHEIGMDTEKGEMYQKMKNSSAYLQCVTKIGTDAITLYYKGEATVDSNKFSVAYKQADKIDGSMNYDTIMDQVDIDVSLDKIQIDSESFKLYCGKDGSLKITADITKQSEDDPNVTINMKSELLIDSKGLVKHVSEEVTEGTNFYSVTADFDYTKSGVPSIKDSDYGEPTETDGIATLAILSAITAGIIQ